MDYSQEPTGVYLVIDNKSFYATVECTARGLDPLTTPLVVMSEAANTNGGLVLASSPAAKRMFNISNVNRRRDLPNDKRLLVVPPRMNLYIERNIAVNNIFREYVADEDLIPYSIDESILNLTHSWRLFGNNILQVVRRIQHEVKERLDLITTVGLGNNPLQAKIALDIYSKHNSEFIGVITYDTVPNKIWPIVDITDIWGINHRTAARLSALNIHNIHQLANADPYLLKEKLGLMGTQLYATAWGIDRTNMHTQVLRRDKSISNSQVLPRDYCQKDEIEVVIKELGAQICSRLRAHNKQAGGVYLSIGYSLSIQDRYGAGFAHSLKLSTSTAETDKITAQLLYLFDKYWEEGAAVRHIGVSVTRLTSRYGEQLDIFSAPRQDKVKVEDVMDEIRRRFGKTAIMRANSLKPGGIFIARSGLVGGHSGGNSFE